MPMSAELREVARDALEAARVEVVRRLGEHGLPTSVDDRRLLVIDTEELTGWQSEWEAVRRSSLTVPAVLTAVDDRSVEFRALGVRKQLEPFARALASETPLGRSIPRGLPVREDATENVLIAYAQPMAFNYLLSLEDLAEDDGPLLGRLLDELAVLVERGVLWQRGQLALDGIRLTSALRPHRGITLRGLSPAEVGHWVQARGGLQTVPMLPDFAVPHRWEHFTPRVVVDWVEEVEAGAEDVVRLHHRLALAFFLRGHDIASAGSCVRFGEPRWASFGVTTVPLPVEARTTATPPAPIDQWEFAAVVDLALSMPPFGPEETTREEVVLHRVLRGCGAQQPAFLDLATALEAALLEGTATELAYRFRLYGALFLAAEHDPNETAEQLKEVYTVRSRLVHGTPVTAARLLAAEATARTLATAVARKAIETGWPARSALDQLALRP
jgi:Apea-like HEPN